MRNLLRFYLFIAKPSKPKGPLKVSDVTADKVNLQWKPPEDDGGEPVDHYVIERMDTDTGRWVPAGTTKVMRIFYFFSKKVKIFPTFSNKFLMNHPFLN